MGGAAFGDHTALSLPGCSGLLLSGDPSGCSASHLAWKPWVVAALLPVLQGSTVALSEALVSLPEAGSLRRLPASLSSVLHIHEIWGSLTSGLRNPHTAGGGWSLVAGDPRTLTSGCLRPTVVPGAPVAASQEASA